MLENGPTSSQRHGVTGAAASQLILVGRVQPLLSVMFSSLVSQVNQVNSRGMMGGKFCKCKNLQSDFIERKGRHLELRGFWRALLPNGWTSSRVSDATDLQGPQWLLPCRAAEKLLSSSHWLRCLAPPPPPKPTVWSFSPANPSQTALVPVFIFT